MGWPITLEPEPARALSAHFGARRGQLFVPADTPLSGPAPVRLTLAPDGRCVCHDGDPVRACAIHSDLGEAALPVPCRHFPRVVLRDGRGLRITLSHFCPTAAATLFDPAPLAVVAAPGRLTLNGEAQGLDATAVLPPLLRPGMLMDLEAYGHWEDQAVRVLGDEALTPLAALARVAAVTASLSTWTPAGGPLAAAVDAAFAGTPRAEATRPPAPKTDARCLALAIDAVPAGLDRPAALDPTATHSVALELWARHDAAVRRYLAARIFGSWFAYDGHGVTAVLAAAALAGAVLRCEIVRRLDAGLDSSRALFIDAVRATDLLLVHLADHRVLARRLDTDLAPELLT